MKRPYEYRQFHEMSSESHEPPAEVIEESNRAGVFARPFSDRLWVVLRRAGRRRYLRARPADSAAASAPRCGPFQNRPSVSMTGFITIHGSGLPYRTGAPTASSRSARKYSAVTVMAISLAWITFGIAESWVLPTVVAACLIPVAIFIVTRPAAPKS